MAQASSSSRRASPRQPTQVTLAKMPRPMGPHPRPTPSPWSRARPRAVRCRARCVADRVRRPTSRRSRARHRSVTASSRAIFRFRATTRATAPRSGTPAPSVARRAPSIKMPRSSSSLLYRAVRPVLARARREESSATARRRGRARGRSPASRACRPFLATTFVSSPREVPGARHRVRVRRGGGMRWGHRCGRSLHGGDVRQRR